MSLPMDYASVCCSYYIQICAITAQIMDLEREGHDKKEEELLVVIVIHLVMGGYLYY